MKFKVCSKCKKEKSLNQFYKDKSKKDECTSICKMCFKEYYKNNQRRICEYKKLYNFKNKQIINNRNKNYFKMYPWKKVLTGIKYRCNNIKCIEYHRYGGRGIKCLITLEELKELWFRDKAYLMKKPSIDRIDNNGNYEYNNCQFIELNKNIQKSNNLRKKRILQFDLDGNFIKEWESLLTVSNFLNIDIRNISQCANKNKKPTMKSYTSSNFIWRFK